MMCARYNAGRGAAVVEVVVVVAVVLVRVVVEVGIP